SAVFTMEDGVSSRFSAEPSDYLLPPSHKVIVLMDHGPRLTADSGCPVTLMAKNAPPERKKATMNRSLWTMAVEATLEAHRVVSDLFPDGSRLIRFVLADAVSRKLSAEWGTTLVKQPELCAQLSTASAPTTAAAAGSADANFLPSGVQLAVETLSETTERYTKVKEMDVKEQLSLIRYASRSFAWKVHPLKREQEDMKREKGVTLGKTNVTKTVVNNAGEEEEESKEVQRPCFLLNKGSILVMTSMKSDAEVAALEKEVTKAIETRNELIGKMAKTKDAAKVYHVSLFILNLLPLGVKSQITAKPLTKINDSLSCGVRSCCVKGDELITGVHGALMPLYDLVSTTVTGIPMKEESNASHSVNYDVELLHERLAHSELARNGLLMENEPKPVAVIDISEEAATAEMEPKKDGEPPSSPLGLVYSLHGNAYSTVRLTWATPSPKTAWNMFPRSLRAFPVSPAYLNARPSICLTSFLGQGKSVMLEVKNPPLAPLLTVEEQEAGRRERKARKERAFAAMPVEKRKMYETMLNKKIAARRRAKKGAAKAATAKKGAPTAKAPVKERQLIKRRGTGMLPNLHGTRLISHTLIAHSGRIYIHEIALDGGTTKRDMPRQAAGFKPVPNLRVDDFRMLMREMMIALPSKEKMAEAAKKKANRKPGAKAEIPNADARSRALRLTRYWPLQLSHSFIYNVKQRLEPLFSLMRQAELSTADVDKCKQTIKTILTARESADLFTYTKFECEIVTDQQNREEQLSTLLREITAHLTNYAAHSERHTEVFTMWAQLSEEENACALEPKQIKDVNLATRFDNLFVPEVNERWRVQECKKAGGVTDDVANVACTRHGGAAAR
ncbi:hypothetical protein PFISCL1PPCAC_16597, partial [Pristionchus fissidentatus]